MNRIWIFLCFLCIPWVARGQSEYNWKYWFDTDDARQQGGMAEGDAFTINAETDGLDDGFHAFHVQIADTAGKYSPPHSQMFFHHRDHTVKSLRYWFDNDAEHVFSMPFTAGTATIDVGQLEPGVHFVYCQAEDRTGMVSDVMTRCFFRQMNTKATQWSYWFDDNPDVVQTVPFPSEVAMIDVSELSEGFHTIHSQLMEHTPSDVMSRMFIKIPQTENTGDMTCICTVDQKLVAQDKMPASGGIISWQMDVDSLDVGLHRAVFQAITPTGAASTIAERYFVRVISDKEMGRMKCVYSLDNQQTFAQPGTMSAAGKFHFDLDVSSMEEGLHRLAYMMVSEEGVTTPQKTAFFWKIPLGGTGIVQYDYWLNDESTDVHTTRLDKRENPFRLISLLPVDAQPIRSSCFHFEVKDDQPMVYAKNDFHLRFYDTSGRSLSETRQFVDESVKEEVTPIGTLQSTQTFDRVGDNAIRWYTLDAAPGDIVSFKTSQACTMQLFSPSGKEVYATSGAASVAYGGCHTWEDGIYYLAVHDVMGSRSNMTLDYMHMDKYDVVSQDVNVVGNGGCSTITFKGNGFKDLYDVKLIDSAGHTIKSVDIGHESDAQASVTFDFSNAALGMYDAVFYFTTEDKKFHNVITVEEARDIELATTVTYPSTFLRGTSTTYTIKITNKGNMTAYAVPLEMQLLTQGKDAIRKVRFSDNIPPVNISWLDTTQIPEDSIKALQEWINKEGDLLHFISAYDSIDGRYFKESHLSINIAPNSVYAITVSIVSEETVELQALVPTNWICCTAKSQSISSKAKVRRKISKEDMCCVRERVECVMNVIVGALDFASFLPQVRLADCIASLGNTTLQYAYDVWCGEELGGKNARKAAEDLVWDAINGLIGCAIPGGKKWEGLQGLHWVYQHIYNNISTTWDCVSAFSQKIPNCPPNNGGDGGKSSPVSSIDPNEIYGYVAPSGSMAVKKDMIDMCYTIQFENDPEFATASAHDVWVADTLDAMKFDLSTYEPVRISIGEKTAELSGEQNFVKTIDMRPDIYAIAEVKGTFDEKTGIARWHITSLDPMTMEPTDDPMDGFLPVNYNGNGIGEVTYNISLRRGLKDGTEIPNRAGIVFDINDVIMTPTWTNVIDNIAPTSSIVSVSEVNDSTASVSIKAEDNRSGAWKYDVYVQYGRGSAWFKMAENVPVDSVAKVRIYEDIDQGFYVLATDSAGNVEQKEAVREVSLYNGTTRVEGITEQTQPEMKGVYTIDGVRLGDAVEPSRLKKGVYIVNGRKRVVK